MAKEQEIDLMTTETNHSPIKISDDETKWNKTIHCKKLNILIYTQVQRLSQISLLQIIIKTIATSVN